MGEQDPNADGDVSPREYLDRVLSYLQTQGWETTSNTVNASAAVVACARSRSGERERRLCLVETAAETEVTLEHVKYLLSIGKEKSIGNLAIATPGELSADAEKAATEYDVEILDTTAFGADTAAFGLDADEIDLPDSSTAPDSGDSTTATRSPDEAEAEMTQEEASLREVIIMLLGSGLALIGFLLFAGGSGPVGLGASPALKLIAAVFLGLPALFVAITTVDDYFNLHLFGSWRVRKENTAGAMGSIIVVLSVFGNDACNGCSGLSLVFVGGAILLFYSASIFVVQIFFERRRGRR